jgi:hypothetical protein
MWHDLVVKTLKGKLVILESDQSAIDLVLKETPEVQIVKVGCCFVCI